MEIIHENILLGNILNNYPIDYMKKVSYSVSIILLFVSYKKQSNKIRREDLR